MDQFDLTKLSTDREHLSKILRAFSEMQVKIGFMVARDDLLKIFGSNDGRRRSGAPTINYLTATMEYLGEEERCYFHIEDAIKALNDKGPVITIPSRSQPLGWDDDLMDKSFKANDGAEFDPKALKNAFSYLMRPDLSKTPTADYFGIVFRKDELITTTSQLMLIQTGFPVVTASPRMLGFDAAVSLYSILKTDFVSELHLGVARKTGLFGIRAQLDDGVEMFFWSKPAYGPIDTYKDPRPAVDPRSIGFVVHTPFLESILKATADAAQKGDLPVVSLQTTDTGLKYTSYMTDDKYNVDPRAIYQGEIPMTRSMTNPEHVTVCARVDNLIQAVKGLGDSAQFIVPFHPILGLQIHPIEPFYVNCNPQQFALIAPFVLDRDESGPLERLKRKANNAMEI